MTTRPDGAVVLRERAADWPIFADAHLPDAIGALSVQVDRAAVEHMDIAVARATRLLEAGLSRTVLADRFGFWLLMLGRPVERIHKVAALRAAKRGLWGGLADAGVSLPEGPRSEVEVRYPEIDALGFGGSIRFPRPDLPVALELTRTHNALCLVTGSDPVSAVIPDSLDPVHGVKSPEVLPRAIRLVADGTCVLAARGYGAFDDRAVGADVFGHVDLLDEVESALRTMITDPQGVHPPIG